MRVPGSIQRWSVWALLLLWVAVFSDCRGGELPDQMIGFWVSDHERYDHCYMKIDADYIYLGTNVLSTSQGVIEKVSRSPHGADEMVTIEYSDLDDTAITLNLVFVSSGNGVMWFENQPDVIWQRRIFPYPV